MEERGAVMARETAGFDQIYAAEMNDLLVERLGRLLGFGLLMYPSFIFLDLILAAPEQYIAFFVIRGLTMLFMVGLLLSLRSGLGVRFARLLSWLLLLVASGTIAIMSTMLGGFDSYYFVGIVFCTVVCDRFLPWSPRETLGLGLLILSFYFATQFALAPAPVDQAALASAVAFMVGTQIFFYVASVLDQRSRRHELDLRLKIEESEKALRVASEARSRFLANVSHELRTPLSLILAPLEILQGGGQMDRPALYASMETNARRLLRQVNMLLEFARLDGGVTASNPVHGGLDTLIRGLVEAALPRAERKGLTLTMEGLDALPSLTYDKGTIETILANLLSNALKFTPEGGAVCVRAGVRESALWLEVEDDGIGIDRSMQQAIFQRFIQVENEATRRFEGSGMGLALVRELVEGMEGSVHIESALGHGSCFRVELPRLDGPGGDFLADNDERLRTLMADGDEASIIHRVRTVSPPPGALLQDDRPRLLLAEDNPDMQVFLARHLSNFYEVEVTSNGAEALLSVLVRRPDIVVTDVMMPEMDGLELCRRIRKEEHLQDLPIILVTARGSTEDLVSGFDAGASDYISKPLILRELNARIESLLRADRLQRSLDERELRLAAVGRSAAMVVHDLRNPLANIFGLLDLLGLTSSDFEQSSEGALLIAESQRLNRMLTEILDFSRGQIYIQRERVDVQAFITEILDATAQRGHLDRIEVVTDFARAEGLQIELDRSRIFRVVENLILNAEEALRKTKASPTIWVSVEVSDAWLCLKIADNGPGLKEGTEAEIFKPFVTHGKLSGTGLGLAMARESAIAHGGTLECQARCERGGAEFVLRLPWSVEQDSAPSTEARKGLLKSTRTGSRSAL